MAITTVYGIQMPAGGGCFFFPEIEPLGRGLFRSPKPKGYIENYAIDLYWQSPSCDCWVIDGAGAEWIA